MHVCVVNYSAYINKLLPPVVYGRHQLTRTAHHHHPANSTPASTIIIKANTHARALTRTPACARRTRSNCAAGSALWRVCARAPVLNLTRLLCAHVWRCDACTWSTGTPASINYAGSARAPIVRHSQHPPQTARRHTACQKKKKIHTQHSGSIFLRCSSVATAAHCAGIAGFAMTVLHTLCARAVGSPIN